MNLTIQTVWALLASVVFSLACLTSAGAAELAASPATQPTEQPAGKPRVCVMTFEVGGDLAPHLGSFLYNTLVDQLVTSDAFVVVDWEQIGQMLRFIQQSQPNLLLEDARVQALNRLGVEKLYFGSLSKVGRKYHLSVKVLSFDLTVERTERAAVFTEDELEQAVAQIGDRLVLPRTRMSWANGTYDGCVLNGKPHGQGTLHYEGRDGLDRYEGQWKDGKRNGQGTLFYATGNKRGMVRCEGQWRGDQATGTGTITWESGDKYVGQLSQGIPNGQGTLYHATGDREEGVWKSGKLDGQAALYTSKNEKAVGLCVMGKKEGTWTFYDRDNVQIRKVAMEDRLASSAESAR